MTANKIDGGSLSHVNMITTVEPWVSTRFTQKELLTQKNVWELIMDIESVGN